MLRRLAAGAAVLSLLGAVPALGGSSASEDETITVPIGWPEKEVTTKTAIPSDKPFSLILAGTHRYTELGANPRTTKMDALYCFEGCEGGVVPQFNLLVASQRDNWQYRSLRSVLEASKIPPYNPSHRYRLTARPVIAGYGRLKFKVAVPQPRPAAGFNYKYGGSYSIEIVGPFTEEEADAVRVNFVVRSSGKPNVPLKGYASPRTLVSSRVSGSGHATFTKKNAAVLIATETKGSIVHEDTYSDGTKHTLTFGIVSGTRYYANLRRLALVLRLKESNDPDCQTGFLISTTFGVLTLLPHEDAAPNGGTAIFFGLPKSKATDPCKHAHGWTSSPRERVTVRILLAESTP